MVNQYVPYTIKLNETSMSLTQIKGNQNLMNRLTPGKTKLKPLIFVSYFLINQFGHGVIFSLLHKLVNQDIFPFIFFSVFEHDQRY